MTQGILGQEILNGAARGIDQVAGSDRGQSGGGGLRGVVPAEGPAGSECEYWCCGKCHGSSPALERAPDNPAGCRPDADLSRASAREFDRLRLQPDTDHFHHAGRSPTRSGLTKPAANFAVRGDAGPAELSPKVDFVQLSTRPNPNPKPDLQGPTSDSFSRSPDPRLPGSPLDPASIGVRRLNRSDFVPAVWKTVAYQIPRVNPFVESFSGGGRVSGPAGARPEGAKGRLELAAGT
jgi:hypothetical protein